MRHIGVSSHPVTFCFQNMINSSSTHHIYRSRQGLYEIEDKQQLNITYPSIVSGKILLFLITIELDLEMGSVGRISLELTISSGISILYSMLSSLSRYIPLTNSTLVHSWWNGEGIWQQDCQEAHLRKPICSQHMMLTFSTFQFRWKC